MGWVTGVTWLLVAVAAAVVLLAVAVSTGRAGAHLPGSTRLRDRESLGALERLDGSGIEWSQQRISTEQIREHAHGRHETQDR